MTHTEKYELPIIEGTDVIDYEPFNEGMEKIEEVLENNENLVQEAVDDVAEMGDTLNEKVAEVNQALEQTETNVNQALEQTTGDLTNMVNNKLNRMSTYYCVRNYAIPDDTYYFGSDSGNMLFPLGTLTPTVQRGATILDNKFSFPGANQSGTPVSVANFDFEVIPTASEGAFNGDCYVEVEFIKYRPGQTSVTLGKQRINTSVQTPIHATCLVTGNNGEHVGIILRSNYTHKLVGYATLTVENIGMNN